MLQLLRRFDTVAKSFTKTVFQLSRSARAFRWTDRLRQCSIDL